MHNRDSMKRALASRAKKVLEKTGYLTSRQIDMAITAMLSMPCSVMEDAINRIEADPSVVLKEMQIPGKKN